MTTVRYVVLRLTLSEIAFAKRKDLRTTKKMSCRIAQFNHWSNSSHTLEMSMLYPHLFSNKQLLWTHNLLKSLCLIQLAS